MRILSKLKQIFVTEKIITNRHEKNVASSADILYDSIFMIHQYSNITVKELMNTPSFRNFKRDVEDLRRSKWNNQEDN